jgi:hypothetical protein
MYIKILYTNQSIIIVGGILLFTGRWIALLSSGPSRERRRPRDSLFDFLFEFQNRIFLEFFVQVSSCSNIKPFKVRGSTVLISFEFTCYRPLPVCLLYLHLVSSVRNFFVLCFPVPFHLTLLPHVVCVITAFFLPSQSFLYIICLHVIFHSPLIFTAPFPACTNLSLFNCFILLLSYCLHVTYCLPSQILASKCFPFCGSSQCTYFSCLTLSFPSGFSLLILSLIPLCNSSVFFLWDCGRGSGAHPEFFLGGGGGDPEAIYNLCLILKIIKIML